MFYIYGLRLKDDTEYRYIGCTLDPDTRMLAHTSYDKRNRDKHNWIKANAANVEMVILAQREDPDEASKEEARQIANHRRTGHRLFNRQSHSPTRHAMSDETKAKLSQPKKRRLTPEQRQAALREWFKED